MGAKITLCHWNEGGSWSAIEVAQPALSGHENHEMDIWPAIPDVTPGHNWPQGEQVYLNGCVLPVSSSPSPSPTDLPSTGTWYLAVGLLLSAVLIGIGLLLLGLRQRILQR